MAVRPFDPVSANIDEELGLLSREKVGLLSPAFSDCCIFKVHHQLRKINEQAYQPTIISIGPYHHGNDKLRFTEKLKLRYLQLLLQRRNETNVDRYVISMRNLVERARRCYAEAIDVPDDDKFIKNMLLDGCFIIELFRRPVDEDMHDRSDPVSRMPWLGPALMLDLLLLENQLPFFVLEELFNMTKYPTEKSLISLALDYFEGFCGTKNVEGVKSASISEVTHLLGLVYCSRLPLLATTRSENERKSMKIRCATELREAGIKFKAGCEGCIFNLNFKEGDLTIPPLKVDDATESFFRNLIAYEQHDGSRHHYYYFTDYVIFFDCLINSPKDVECLVKGNTILNDLGDEQAVSNMFNKLGENVIYTDNFYYSHIVETINKHCDTPCNEHLANLRHNYFNSPWSLASFLAAVSLLLLTIMQTLFSILSYMEE